MRHASRTIIFFAVTALIAFGMPDAMAQVTASFALIPEQTLPGIPVDFRLTLSSASSQPVTLRNAAVLEVTTETGERFLATDPLGDTAGGPLLRTKEASNGVVVQPGTTRDYYWTVGCDLSHDFFLDPRFSKPGRYSLRLKVFPEGVFGDSALAIWSSAATLTVQQPQGDDAAIWAMLLDIAGKRGRDGFSSYEWIVLGQFQIAQDIYTKYPRSSYVPYVACFKPARLQEDRLRHLEAALALNPKGPIADRLKISMAGVRFFLAEDARVALDAEGAIAQLNIARQILQEVSARSAYPLVRDQARNTLDSLGSDEWVRKDVEHSTNSRRKSPHPQVIPFVECVSIQHDGGLTARFGYKNIKDQTETIAEGSSNNIYPAGAAKNLPTTFRSGIRKNAMRATSSGVPITWKLLSFQVTATKNSPSCKGND